jgi:16S rRNA (uracil1498-N3)-methyltransferase
MTTFFSPDPIPESGPALLSESAAHHARVKRLEIGAPITLVDGAGARADGSLIRISKTQLTVDVARREHVEAPAPVHLLVPIADRDRMLWLAEKATELGIASWRPVSYRRSKSVSPRGEGMTFQGKVQARMTAALEQSGGAWLPMLFPDATLERAIAAAPSGWRVLLDVGGDSVDHAKATAPVVVALGPEGGLEESERAMFVAAGFKPLTLSDNILRFETAGIAGIAVARAAVLSNVGATRD